MRTAEGWPAVLGLAAMSGDVDFTSSRLLSHTLYDFLASELLAAAAEETQDALMLLAVASITDVEVARSVLGANADEVLEDAVARGLVALQTTSHSSLHPLLRELLTRRFEEADAETREAAALASPQIVRLAPVGRGVERLRGSAMTRRSPPKPSRLRSTTCLRRAGRAASSAGSRLRVLPEPKVA